MRVTLVTSPFFDHASYYTGSEPAAQVYVSLGLLSLGAQLLEEGVEVHMADLNQAYNDGLWKGQGDFYESGAAFVSSSSPDVVGFLTAYDSYHHILNIARVLKEHNPALRIVLGGYQATAVDEPTLEGFPFVDAVVRGEGETAFSELVRCYRDGRDPESVQGITLRKGARVLRTPNPPLISDLDTLPFPAYHLSHLDPRSFLYVEVGRGCPFHCTYCSTAPFWQRTPRYKSVERVVSELIAIENRYSISNFHLVHDLFTVRKDWVLSFCEAAAELPFEAKWTCSASINTITEPLIERMADAGCSAIYFGIETGSDQIRRRIQKSYDPKRAEAVIRKVLECGISPVTGFIAGFPFETEETLSDTLRCFFDYKRLGVGLAHLFVAIPEAGSALYREHKDNLWFNEHFLDFPVPPRLRCLNEGLAKNHPDVFCGLYRFHNESLEPKILQGIDELSPLVNTLHVPVGLAVEEIHDPLAFYLGWLHWLARRDPKKQVSAHERFYGSIDDMLGYLSDLIESGALRNDCLAAIVAYEAMKNDFRRKLATINQDRPDNWSGEEERGGGRLELRDMQDWYLMQSPHNAIAQLDVDVAAFYSGPKPDLDSVSRAPIFILLHVQPRKSAAVGDFFKDILVDVGSLKIDPITKVLLDLSDGQTRLASVAEVLAKVACRELGARREEALDMVLERVERLLEVGVLGLVRPSLDAQHSTELIHA